MKKRKKLNKKELLEILVLQSKKIDELEASLNETRNKLESKQIIISKSGSIAEASLKLNKVFETAENSANQYLDNIKRIEKEQIEICEKLKKEYKKIEQKRKKQATSK